MFKVKIKQDTIIESPREDDNIGTMVCWHPRYTLGDEQPTLAPLEWRMDMWQEHGTDEEHHARFKAFVNTDMPFVGLREALEEGEDLVEILTYYEVEHPEYSLPQRMVALPLYLYDHSGITMNTTGFSCIWDTSTVGWIYRVLEEGETEAQILDVLRQEVETYDQYLTGDVWGYEIVDDNDEMHASCWGFYGREYCEQEAEAARKHLAATVPQTITPTRETA